MKIIFSPHKSLFILMLQSIVLILFIGQTTSGQTSALNVKNNSGQSLLLVQENGKTRIGLGTDTSGTLSIFGNDGIVAMGTLGSGAVLSLGGGTRMMWYPQKAAFRAGIADGSEWDDANIGSYSIAMGSGTTASGSFSTAMGVSTIASGYNSTAMGFRSIASGMVSTAMGYYTTAGGDYSTVIGRGVDGSNRLVNSTSSSLMVGFNSTIPTLFVGPSSGAGTFGKVGIGTSSPATALQVAGTIYSSAGGIKFPDGTVQTTAATSGGDGKWSGDSSIYYNAGNVGIGTATPLTKLHVKDSDISLQSTHLLNELITVEDLDAGLGLYSDNGGNYGSVLSMGEVVSGALTNKWSIYRTTSAANPANQLRISFGSNANYASNPAIMSLSANGRVGIGTTAPLTKLQIADTIYSSVGGFKFPDGTIQTTAATGGGGGVASIDNLIDGKTDSASVFLGSGAGLNDGGNHENTAVGIKALSANSSGERNVANGFETLYSNTDGDNNTANGCLALFYNQHGNHNTVMGAEAMFSNTYGSHNVAAGYRALYHNIGSGQGAEYDVDGSYNIAIGTQALFSNTGASHNIAAGYQALYSNVGTLVHSIQEGDHNIALGYQSLFSTNPGGLSPVLISAHNFGAGYRALYNNTTGNGNVAIGYQSGMTSTVGDHNTFLGYGADASTGNLHNATAIGYNAVVDASNKVRIGNDSVTVIQGKVDFTYTSDRNKKENFLDIDGEQVLQRIKEFRLQSWNYKHDAAKARHYGPVAQDFFSAFGDDGMGVIGSDTTLCGSDVNGINMIAIQALEKQTAELKKENAELQKENAEMKARLEAIESAVKNLSSADAVLSRSY
jgi:trimeric autotransporter adhesin